MSTLNWAVVAAPDDPARTGWSAAARAAGVPEPRFVPWRAVLADEAGFQAGEQVMYERLEGWAPTNPVGGQAARFELFAAALHRLDLATAEAGAHLVAAASPALLMLDRVERDAHLRQNGLPILGAPEPEQSLTPIARSRYTASDDWIIDGWHTRMFLHRTRDGFEVWQSPAEAPTDMADIRQIIELLKPDGVHTVAGFHRCYLGSSFYDLRFQLVDGKVTHAAGVPRERFQARPWYGGRRRELEIFVERFGQERWELLVTLAERTAALFPDNRSLGVDLIVDNHDGAHVFDVDPFGADLPGLTGLPDTAGADLGARAAVLRALSAES